MSIDLDMLAGPTRHGIDLVAVERVRKGCPTELTEAERDFLMATYDGTAEQARQIAAALGITKSGVEKRHQFLKQQAARRPT